MVSTFDTLPSEVQQLIIEALRYHPYNVDNDHIADFCKCILVCKKWKHLSQKFLYSDVYLFKFSKLQQFLATIVKNQPLQNLVKKLYLYFKISGNSENENKIIARLFFRLPNLEYIKGYLEGFYPLVFDALSNSCLQNLNYIQGPSTPESVNDYYACAIMIKDRLKNFDIMKLADSNEEEDDIEDEGRFYRLFKKIDQFKNINDLGIIKESGNVIDLIENLTSHCIPFKDLQVYIEMREEDNESSLFGANEVTFPNSSPLLNVSRLEFEGNLSYDSPFSLYLIHKFPRLKLLTIAQKARFLDLDDAVFKKFVTYILKINSVSFSNINWKEESIGFFWKHASQSHILQVEINYAGRSGFSYDGDNMIIEINGNECFNKIQHYYSGTGIQHTNILKHYGHNIDCLTLYKFKSSLIDCEQEATATTNNILVLQALQHCVKLKTLSVYSSSLKGMNVVDDNFSSLKILDTLGFDDCIIEDDYIFENLSAILSHVNYLQLHRIVKLDDPDDKDAAFKSIKMTDTKIGTLSISKNPYSEKHYSEERIVLVNISTQQDQRFYVYDYETMYDHFFKPVDTETYHNNYNHGECFVIGVSCKSLELLDVKHLKKNIRLRID